MPRSENYGTHELKELSTAVTFFLGSVDSNREVDEPDTLAIGLHGRGLSAPEKGVCEMQSIQRGQRKRHGEGFQRAVSPCPSLRRST